MIELHAKECEIYEGKSLVAQTYGGPLYQHCNDKSYGESVMLAKKMSACEDMYEALENIMSDISNMNDDGEYVISIDQDGLDRIEQALAKARGED